MTGWVKEWMKRAAPIHREEVEALAVEIRELAGAVADLRGRAIPALKPILKAVGGHLHWAEKALREWLLRNPD